MKTGAALSLVVVLLFAGCAVPVSDEELAARVEGAHPTWQSYQEDLKAQLGAGPVAEWQGELVAAVQEGETLRLTFQLTGPWSGRDCFAPVLVADPREILHPPVSAVREKDSVVYRFSLPSAGPLPWVEVKFPNGQMRLVFDQNGVWPPSP